jgi:hypothetical protein
VSVIVLRDRKTVNHGPPLCGILSNRVDDSLELGLDDFGSLARFALRELLATTKDNTQAGLQRLCRIRLSQSLV